VTRQSFSGIAGWARKPGRYLLRVHYTRLWEVSRGRLCVLPGPRGMTVLDVRRAGRFSIAAAEEPGGVLLTLLGDHPGSSGCPAGSAR
jgi:hypothetical protein